MLDLDKIGELVLDLDNNPHTEVNSGAGREKIWRLSK